ncbi:MAG TPA: NAD(P)/FAD-dependent oxidoreductase [Thermoanaerobaculia bacterium]|nr:NAD(P)/FAD-dependent oxidoreductase [Thermoanaerobaculia bacterium]
MTSHLSELRPDHDAIVVGGGPAGAAAATWLARRERRVLVVERQRFPRFHIGESLIPETNRWLDAIGVRERIAAAGFPVKRGAIIVAPDGEHERYAFFGDAEGVARPETFEVPRDRFDEILLDHAAACGAEVLQECRAKGVELFENGARLRIEDAAGGERTVSCRFLVDASGRDGFLAKRLKLRTVDPELRQVGLHAWYEGVVPPPADRAGDIRVVAIDGEGWAWLIPLGGGITSVGAVVSRERHAGLPAGEPERCLDLLLGSVPALPPLLAEATRVTPVRIDADYSYTTQAYCGGRWLVAGDAGSFLDPIFSTGVLLALASGVQAAEAVDGALAAAEEPAAVRRLLAAYDREQRRKYRYFRRFVTGYYRPEFRDLLVATGGPFGVPRAVATALAGNSRPSLATRLRMAAFFSFVRLQRLLPIAPRLHGPAAERRLTAPEQPAGVPGAGAARAS